MKCFYHPEKDAVGMCPQCGKAACRDCILEVRGGILCKGCIAQRAQQVRAENTAIQQDRQATIDRAKARLRTGKIVFIAFLVIGLITPAASQEISPDPGAPGLPSLLGIGIIGSPIVGYIAWSFYWGFPAIWRGLRNMFSKLGCFVVLNPITWLIFIFAFFMVAACFGEVYSIFGGGVSQYLKTRQLARGEV